MDILFYFIIFFARVIDVSLTTLRTIFMVQGKKLLVFLMGTVEAVVYVVILGKIVSDLNDPIKILAYGLGFAAGNVVGILIEERLALGELAVEVILTSADNDALIEEIREQGFGVTVINAQGKTFYRDYLIIIIRRKAFPKLVQTIKAYDEQAFIMSTAVDPVSGGTY